MWVKHSNRIGRSLHGQSRAGGRTMPRTSGVIQYRASLRWKTSAYRSSQEILAHAKRVCRGLETCVGFAMNAKEGVELYNQDGVGVQGRHLSFQLDWTTYIASKVQLRKKKKIKVPPKKKAEEVPEWMKHDTKTDELRHIKLTKADKVHEIKESDDEATVALRKGAKTAGKYEGNLSRKESGETDSLLQAQRPRSEFGFVKLKRKRSAQEKAHLPI